MKVTQFDFFIADLDVVSQSAPFTCQSNEECARVIKQWRETGDRTLELIADSVNPSYPELKHLSGEKFNALREYLFANMNSN